MTSRDPRVSVVVPVYNAAPYLRAAIESILAQTYTDIEVIISDDGSTDGSLEIARSFGDRVRVLTQPNAGPSAARNAGLEAARGEWIAFCDADDVQLPHRVEAHCFLLERSRDAAVVAGDFSVLEDGHIRHEFGLHHVWLGPTTRPFEEELEAAFPPWTTCRAMGVPVPKNRLDRRVYRGRVAPLIALINLAWVNASLFRRSALDEVGGFDESYTHFEDWHLVGRISKRHEIVYVDVPVMQYRRHPNQISRAPLRVADGYLRMMNEVWRSDARFYEENARLVRRAAGAAHYQAGAFFASQRDWAGAERRFIDSILSEPRQKRVYLELLKVAIKRRAPRFLPF